MLFMSLMIGLGACASKKSVTSDTVYKANTTQASLIADALGRYRDWETARISGKLRLSSLPVTPSLKIYMKRNKELIVSASAIFVGEVFRAELTEDSLLIVNKLKKVYCKESGEKLKEIYPTLCEELQSVLLGRMIVPGSGTLSEANIEKVTIETENELRKISPSLAGLPLDIGLYYLLDNVGRISNLKVEGENKAMLFCLNYDWKGDGGVEMDASVRRKNKSNLQFEIDLDSPQWGGKPLSAFKLGGGYKRVGLQDFFKSI